MLQAQPGFISVEATNETIGVYGMYELEIRLNSSAANPYDYNQAWLKGIFTAPDGEVFVQDGFYYQHFMKEQGQLIPEGDPYWKVRFSPGKTGAWSVYLMFTDASGTASSETLAFNCISSGLSSLPSFYDDQFYLSDREGNTVFLIGENIAWAEYQSGVDRMHEYMEGLSASGANFAKLMMVPWSYSIEWGAEGLKHYGGRQDRAFMLDSVFSMADRLGLYLQLAFSIHDELRTGFEGEDWRSNPYNQLNGGPCAEPREFFSDPVAMDAFRNRMRYINARWGYSQRLFGWELFSEADNFPDYSQFAPQVAGWAGLMAESMKQYDLFQRPVSIGFALTKSNPEAWAKPDIGFTQFHYYGDRPDLEGETFRLTGVYRDAYQKPVLGGEYGIGYIMDSIIAFDPAGWAIHNGLWASAMSGSFGAAVPWFWDAYIHELGLYYRFTGISRFMEEEQISGMNFQPVQLHSETDNKTDFLVVPKFDELNQKAPSNTFELSATGVLTPAPDSLGTLLFGPSSVFSGLRNPPVFHGKWSAPSIVDIRLGQQINSGVLQVKIDGQIVVEQDVIPNQLVQFTVPAGTHSIEIDNTGSGFLSIIELDEIVFHQYLPLIRGFSLMNGSRALVWVHKRMHNWHWYRTNTELPEAVDGSVVLPFYEGSFQVDFYHTVDGILNNSIILIADENGLVVPISALSADVALKVSMLTTIEPKLQASGQLLAVFPNPSTGNVTFAFETNTAGPVILEISDLQGRLVYRNQKHLSVSGLQQIRWEPSFHHKGQLFLYRLTHRDKNFTGKIQLH